MRIFRRPLESWILRVLFALFICFWAGGPWQRSSTAQTLSSKAKESFERGKIAAGQQAWDLALEHFEEAHKYAPKAPEVLYALGTTHEQVGHPVVAAVFLHAYLEAWPDAPNADRVQRKILELEVFTDRLAKDLFKEALSAAEGLPELRWDVQRAVIKSMAEAGELGLVRDFGLKHPSGVSTMLQRVALDITNRMRKGMLVRDKPSPRDLFLLAGELIYDAEADEYASLPSPEIFYKPARPTPESMKTYGWTYEKYKKALESYPERIRAIEREIEKTTRHWESEKEVRRRLFYHRGLLLIGFGVNLWDVGFKDWGLQYIRQGGDDVAQSGLYDYDSFPDSPPIVGDYICIPLLWGYTFTDHKGMAAKVAFVGVESTRVYLRPGQQSHPEKKKLPVRSWLDVVRTGGVGDPWHFRLYDPAFVRLTSLIEKIKSRAVEKIPRELAKLADRFAVVHQFLQFNRP